ncbi:Protein RALF-like 34 [Platanthera guangdongensis]|uniref:Protein RALF-like 34 n=1 Tax=Platanthera guangdongensis TaxID=2320717 RepID=A0ABR2LRX4_9ASPA
MGRTADPPPANTGRPGPVATFHRPISTGLPLDRRRTSVIESLPSVLPPHLTSATVSMADTTFSLRPALFLLLLIAGCFSGDVKAQLDSGSLHLLTDSMEWPGAAYSFPFGPDDEEDLAGEPGEKGNRLRSLFWRRRYHLRYYISYGAMSANRIPCPPRSGRSYYTHNCYHARGPVCPYSRGCNAITRCRR